MNKSFLLALAIGALSYTSVAQSDTVKPQQRNHEIGLDFTVFAAHANKLSLTPSWSGQGGFFVFEAYYKRHLNNISLRGSLLFFNQHHTVNISSRGHFIKLGAEYAYHTRKYHRLYAGADVLVGHYGFDEYRPFIPLEMQEGRVPYLAAGVSPFLGIDLKFGKQQGFIVGAQLGPDLVFTPKGTISESQTTVISLPRGVFSRISLGYKF